MHNRKTWVLVLVATALGCGNSDIAQENNQTNPSIWICNRYATEFGARCPNVGGTSAGSLCQVFDRSAGCPAQTQAGLACMERDLATAMCSTDLLSTLCRAELDALADCLAHLPPTTGTTWPVRGNLHEVSPQFDSIINLTEVRDCEVRVQNGAVQRFSARFSTLRDDFVEVRNASPLEGEVGQINYEGLVGEFSSSSVTLNAALSPAVGTAHVSIAQSASGWTANIAFRPTATHRIAIENTTFDLGACAVQNN